MRKKLVLLSLALFLILALGSEVLANETSVEREVKLLINGEYVESDVKPFIEDGRTLVPIRIISEVLGYEVSWDGDLDTVTISAFSERFNGFENIIVLNINSPVLITFDLEKINSLFGKREVDIRDVKKIMEESAKSEILDVSPRILENRTFVPIRVIAESMGETVTWDHDNWTVIIGEMDE